MSTKLYSFKKNIIVRKDDSKYGLIEPNGKEIIPCDGYYSYIGQPHEGVAVIRVKNGKSGFINEEGEFIIDPIFEWASPILNGYSAVQYKNAENKTKFAFIHVRSCRMAITDLDDACPVLGQLRLSVKGRNGFFDPNLSEIVYQ